MASSHPLDRAVWHSLEGRHASFAVARGGARRYHPALGVFASIADWSVATLADFGALIGGHGDVAWLEDDLPAEIPGVKVVSADLGVQMIARTGTMGQPKDARIVALCESDAPEMLALATLTGPGPFFSLTHRLGGFYGIKSEGRLVAMAGERMKPAGFTEVSGVCTHPDHRGRGYAGALMRHVSKCILDRGERPFLHAYASNRGAIGLYERIGFIVRRQVLMTRLTRAG